MQIAKSLARDERKKLNEGNNNKPPNEKRENFAKSRNIKYTKQPSDWTHNSAQDKQQQQKEPKRGTREPLCIHLLLCNFICRCSLNASVQSCWFFSPPPHPPHRSPLELFSRHRARSPQRVQETNLKIIHRYMNWKCSKKISFFHLRCCFFFTSACLKTKQTKNRKKKSLMRKN